MTPSQRIVLSVIYLLLGHFLKARGSSDCVPVQCLKCNLTETLTGFCTLCPRSDAHCINVVPANIPSNCTPDFKVSIKSTGSSVQEGEDITLTCVHNLPDVNLTFHWRMKGREIVDGQLNKNELALKKVLSQNEGCYICTVNSSCGSYQSQPHAVTVTDYTQVTVIICGISALVLLLITGVAMKVKLTRDHAKHRERMKKAEAERNGGAAFFPPK